MLQVGIDFLRPPRVMDVRAFGSTTSAQKTNPAVREMGRKLLALDVQRISAGRPQDIPPKSILFGFRFLIETKLA